MADRVIPTVQRRKLESDTLIKNSIKYMEELEAKVRPFVINYTTLQGTKCLEALEVRHDYKLDDCYLAQDIQDEDCEEPKNLGHDNW